jgi:hypothetical protein
VAINKAIHPNKMPPHKKTGRSKASKNRETSYTSPSNISAHDLEEKVLAPAFAYQNEEGTQAGAHDGVDIIDFAFLKTNTVEDGEEIDGERRNEPLKTSESDSFANIAVEMGSSAPVAGPANEVAEVTQAEVQDEVADLNFTNLAFEDIEYTDDESKFQAPAQDHDNQNIEDVQAEVQDTIANPTPRMLRSSLSMVFTIESTQCPTGP